LALHPGAGRPLPRAAQPWRIAGQSVGSIGSRLPAGLFSVVALAAAERSNTASCAACSQCPRFPAASSNPTVTCWNACATGRMTCCASPPTCGSRPPPTRQNVTCDPRNPAEDIGPAPLQVGHPRPVRHPRLHLHRCQARRSCAHHHPRRPGREPLDATHPRTPVIHAVPCHRPTAPIARAGT
jgi:hypothetical protein